MNAFAHAGAAPRRWSLHRRLYALAALAVLSSWAAGGSAMYLAAVEANARMREQAMQTLARLFVSMEARGEVDLTAPDELFDSSFEPVVVPADPAFYLQIWSASGRLLLRTADAPAEHAMGQLGVLGTHRGVVDGREHMVVVSRAPETALQVHVAGKGEGVRFRRSLATYYASAAAFMLLPLLALAWWSTRRALAPAHAAVAQVAERGPDNLTPLVAADAPRELAPLLDAVNGLMRRLGEALASERHFTALAAHEMRTPLASLAVQARVVGRCTDPAERAEGLRRLREHVDRCAVLLTQLLTLARMDALPPERLCKEPLELESLLAEVMIDIADEAARRGITLECEFGEPVLHGERTGIEALLRNLLGNAMRHTPDGGRIRVGTGRAGGQLQLRVEDSGPGIQPEDGARLLERFERGSGQRGPGAGLGLAIVASVARLHGAAVQLGPSPLGGLAAEVGFPAG